MKRLKRNLFIGLMLIGITPSLCFSAEKTAFHCPDLIGEGRLRLTHTMGDNVQVEGFIHKDNSDVYMRALGQLPRIGDNPNYNISVRGGDVKNNIPTCFYHYIIPSNEFSGWNYEGDFTLESTLPLEGQCAFNRQLSCFICEEDNSLLGIIRSFFKTLFS